MAFHPPDGTTVTRQPRPRTTETNNNNNELPRGTGNILSIDEFPQSRKERRRENVYTDPWSLRQSSVAPPRPPRMHHTVHHNQQRVSSRTHSSVKPSNGYPMLRGNFSPDYPDTATIPSGRLRPLTLITTTENGGKISNGTVTHLVTSPPSFNKPPPKLPLSDLKESYDRKPQEKDEKPLPSPRPDIDDLKGEKKNHKHDGPHQSVLMCPYCGLCKCAGCKNTRDLPETWLCNDRCLLSADTLVEYGSCLCLVKGLFYHCSTCASCVANDYDDDYVCSDKPCLCSAPSDNHCCARWTAMGAMSLCFPCLLCYLPGKGCVRLCRACYSTQSRGCRCPPRRQQELDHLL
ncbi:protein sprouty homolog 1-like [Glandiceps talaboti]